MPRARPLTGLQGHAIRYDLDALDEDAHVPVNSTSFVGTMTNPCVHCGALKFHAELQTNSCCLNGQLAALPVLPLPPLRLQQLFFGSSPRAVFFREHIRLFNSAMAFASMGVSEVKLGRGIPAFRVHGSTYHLMGPLVGSAHDQPKFAMLYFFDNNEATRARTRRYFPGGCQHTWGCFSGSQYPHDSRTSDSRT